MNRFFILFLACVSTSLIAGKLGDKASLFDGKSLDGWVIENEGQFSVVDGSIKVNRGQGWLRSEKTFGDCIIHIEMRFLEEKANSGIFVRTGSTSHDDEKGYPNNGYQVQALDTLEGEFPIATIIPYGAPPFSSEYDKDALAKAYRPAGEWHIYEIVCLGESIKIRLNGIPVTTGTSIKNLEGHIGIQGEDGLLEYRKIEVTTL